MRIRYLMFLLLLFIPTVSASTPSFTLVNNLASDLVLGNNSGGSLVFVEGTYTPEYFSMNGFNNITVQQHDVIVWNGNVSVTIESPGGIQTVLTNGDSYTTQLTGVYQIRGLLNTNLTTQVRVTSEDYNTILIDNVQTPNGIEIIYDKVGFILNGEVVVKADIVVDDDVVKGTYPYTFTINNITKNHNFNVAEKHYWNISVDEVNSSINATAGANIYLGHYILENKGNVDVEIEIKKRGNSSFMVSSPQPFTLYKKTTARVDIQLQVPITQKPGLYDIYLDIESSKINVTKDFQIRVFDGVKPIIESINFSTDRAYRDNNIVVIATDNNEVANVTLEYDNKVITFDKDNQKFTKTVVFDKLSRYVLNFCAKDSDGNEKCVVVNKTFEKSEIIQGFKNQIVMPTKKIGKYSEVDLFNLTEDVPEGITIELVDFVSVGQKFVNTSYSIRVVDGDGSIKTMTNFDKDVVVGKKGVIKLEVRSEEIASYNGLLRLTTPTYMSGVEDINFKVEFKNYDVPEDFVKPWIDGRDLVCKVVDTDDLSTSYYNCEMKFPIDTRAADISVPTTVGERDKFKGEAGLVQEELNSKKKQFAIFVSLLSVLIIIILFGAYFMIFQYPYVRFTSGHKLKEKYGGEKI